MYIIRRLEVRNFSNLYTQLTNLSHQIMVNRLVGRRDCQRNCRIVFGWSQMFSQLTRSYRPYYCYSSTNMRKSPTQLDKTNSELPGLIETSFAALLVALLD